MFKLCNRCRTVSVSVRRFSTPLNGKDIGANSKLKNLGLWAGAGIATASAFYYMKSDEAINNVDVGDEALTNKPFTRIAEVEVRCRMKSAYGYLLGGLGVTSASAFAFHRAGLSLHIARTNPFVIIGAGVVTLIPLMFGTMSTDYKTQSHLKHVLWGGFHVVMATGLSIVGLPGSPILAQLVLATGCVVGGLSLLASKASPGSLQKYEAPLGMGLGGLVAVALGNMIFPMPILHNVMLYGSLAMYSRLLVTDTQKLMVAVQIEPHFDPINEALIIFAESIAIPWRIVLFLWESVKTEQ